LATSSGAFGSLSRRLALAALALLVWPAVAQAGEAQLTGARVIGIVSSAPGVGPLLLANPGASWEAVYDKQGDTWTAVLQRERTHLVLATFRLRDNTGAVISSDVRPLTTPPRLTQKEAVRLARREPQVRSWISQYDGVTDAASLGDDRIWVVRFYDRTSDDIAEVRIDDRQMKVTDVRTGPQVDWMQGRGAPDSYGRLVNRWWVFIPLALIFVAGLLDWRRPLSLRTLDLVALVAFGGSLHWFNQGDLFVATPLVYPPLVYLLLRMLRVGTTRRARAVPIGQNHMLVLVALLFALVGFRLGLNNQNSNILDVGYASVVGADRILDGRAPYGAMPRDIGDACGGYRGNGDPVGHVQPTNGRCESPVSSGDTYGPTVYLSYLPAVWIFGWTGLWDDLPAAHVTAAAFDLAAILGLFVAGWRLASPRHGLLLAFGWAANPFTLYALNLNTNDAIVGALLAWMLAFLGRPAIRGVLLAANALSKLGPLCLVPLMLSLRGRTRMVAGFAVTTAVLMSVLLLDGGGLRVFWDRTMGYQLDRVTPLSIWTIGTYHPGWPDLRWLQQAAQVVVAVGLLALAVFPRGRKDGAAVAALAAAALIATQAVSSYWFYPYICWWLPAVLAALLLPREPERHPALTPTPAA
jgi:hypothetical protein